MAKYSALLQHMHEYDKATMRDIHNTAASTEEFVPQLSQLIELCR